MYASITRRRTLATGSTSEVEREGRALADLVSRLPGFVAYVALEVQEGEIAALVLFDGRANLEAANQHLTDWRGPDADGRAPGGDQIVWGEVIAQKGL